MCADNLKLSKCVFEENFLSSSRMTQTAENQNQTYIIGLAYLDASLCPGIEGCWQLNWGHWLTRVKFCSLEWIGIGGPWGGWGHLKSQILTDLFLLEEVVASPSTVGASSSLLPEVLLFQSLPRGISSVFCLWNQWWSSLKKMLSKTITLLKAQPCLIESSLSIP